MTASRAILVTSGCPGTRIVTARATAPQRWNSARRGVDGWFEATHQLLGDGVFGGDHHRTRITARPGSHLVVRAVAATPLRGEGASLSATSIRVCGGASVFYAPGALIPHAGSEHVNASRFVVERDGSLVAVSIVVPGRSGMGERGLFTKLRVRTTAIVDGSLAVCEDATFRPCAVDIDGPASFAGAGAVLTVLALGRVSGPVERAVRTLGECEGITGGAATLALGGHCFRSLCRSLGDALAATEALERVVRTS